MKDFLNANLINILAATLFLLLAFFLLFPIVIVLIKSLRRPDGFTLQYYKAFFNNNYYFQSLYNTLLFRLINTVVCLVIGFCLAYMMIESTLMSLNPNLEESAYDMGASVATILRTITIPLLAPGLLNTERFQSPWNRMTSKRVITSSWSSSRRA